MLVTAYFPVTDLRSVAVPGFARLKRPAWPAPRAGEEHMRGFGAVARRPKGGFEGWVGEDRLAVGLHALALRLPRGVALPRGTARVRLIRKASFFDGLLNGRVEILIGFEGVPETRENVLAAASFVLGLPARVRPNGAEAPLRAVAPQLRALWARSTVAHGVDPQTAHVRVGKPICIVEAMAPAPGSGPRSDAAAPDHAGIELTVTAGRPPSEILLITPGPVQHVAWRDVAEEYRAEARHLRTYCLRLLQNVEGLSMLYGLDGVAIDDDRMQNLVNEYTRQINRSRQRMDDFAARKTVEYCYSAFSRLYPGEVDALRARIQASGIRPNVARKVLELLDISQMASIQVTGDFNMEKVMGDKFEDINVSGQGVALGRGAQATVSHSTNAPGSGAELAEALTALAGLVRAEGRADADVEATVVEAAAAKAGAGDEESAVAMLKKSAGWVLDIAKSAGSAVLVAVLKSRLGV
jgi:hypothetical protein